MITYQGIEYICVSDMAAETGFKEANIYNHLRRHGNLDRLGIGYSKSKPCEYCGMKFKSISDVARMINIPIGTIRHWHLVNQHDKIERMVREWLDRK
jgi:hypothetical protein